MTLQQTSFDFGDDKFDEHFFTDIYDTVGKSIGIISGTGYGPSTQTYNINSGSGTGAISGAIGATGPTFNHGLTGATGTGGYYTVGSSNYPTITFNDNSWYSNTKNALDVKGDANFEGDVKLKGKSLSEALDKIEQRLALLTPNIELEDKWDELKELGEKYRKLEKQILEKQKVWDILKK